MPSADPQERRRRLHEAYLVREHWRRAIVEILAWNYLPLARTPLCEYLRRLGIVDPTTGKAFTTRTIEPVLDDLFNVDLIERNGDRVACVKELLELAVRQMRADGRLVMVSSLVQWEGVRWGGYGYLHLRSYDEGVREVRAAYYRQDWEDLGLLLAKLEREFPKEFAHQHPLLVVLTNPFHETYTLELPDDLLLEFLDHLVDLSWRWLFPTAPLVPVLRAIIDRADPYDGQIAEIALAELLLWQGDRDGAAELVACRDDHDALAVQGWIAWLDGDVDRAMALYDEAMRALRKLTGRRDEYLEGFRGIPYVLSLMQSGDRARLDKARIRVRELERSENMATAAVATELALAIEHLRAPGPVAQLSAIDPELGFWQLDRVVPLHKVMLLLGAHWFGPADDLRHADTAGTVVMLARDARHSGLHWIADELDEFGRLIGAASAAAAPPDRRPPRLVHVVQRSEPWEHALRALTDLGRAAASAGGAASGGAAADGPEWRLAWVCKSYHDYRHISIQPRQQKRTRTGWTKGRNVALSRLVDGIDEVEGVTDQDRRVCAQIRAHNESTGWRGHRRTVLELRQDQALLALVGHPAVLLEGDQPAPPTPLQLVRVEPQLVVRREGTDLVLRLEPPMGDGAHVVVQPRGQRRWDIVEPGKHHQQLGMIVGAAGLRLPAAASAPLRAALSNLASVIVVQSDDPDLVVGQAGDPPLAAVVAAQTRVCLRLTPDGEGLRVELVCLPLGPDGPSFAPGAGAEVVMATVDGQRLQARRDLAAERRAAAAVLQGCPVLGEIGLAADVTPRSTPDAEHSLALLEQVAALGGEGGEGGEGDEGGEGGEGGEVPLLWPEGQPIRLRKRAEMRQLCLAVQAREDWFALSGDLVLDDDLVVQLRDLLALLEASPGRYLPLGDGQFVALTDELRGRLEQLSAYTERRGRAVRFAPVTALALDEALHEAGNLQVDRAFRDHVARLRDPGDTEFSVPATLDATLRDYQIEGVRWLSRLAGWGLGACLADDMGLGKTIQALTVCLTRADTGPALVVAPTSVCHQWIEQCRQFTPTLTPVEFGPGDRQATLDAAGPGQLLICSYGLLVNEIERLAAIEWGTVILDEAQAIKNAETRRAQAAMQLRASWRLITTGTPVENHLGELWTLFAFLDPGLLGSRAAFERRFVIPIVQRGDVRARELLRRLVRPFILRRTKAQVTPELPPRTDIRVRVELGEAEAALYEALRQRAVAEIEDAAEAAAGGGVAGPGHLRALAQIMKLRRACCHPRLVVPDAPEHSAKLMAFDTILDDLQSGDHRALVFSQFVDHLTIVRRFLDDCGIEYQYLDGSTPAKERRRRVAAFQAGEGDLFLISLKAGGTGLNLTGADYVIHLDPWWNPAVEDQASDRAHRIGQTRPVTIYRLITAGTIEERIVALHERKRDLADQLLAGTDSGTRLTLDELRELLTSTP